MSLITPPKRLRERKLFHRPVLLAVLAFLVVASIGGTLMGPSSEQASPANTVASAPKTTVDATPAPTTTLDPRKYDCPKLNPPADAKYERRDLGIGTYYEVIAPDGLGNFLGFGVALYEGGPVYDSTLCAKQEILLGPTSDKIEYLKVCEVKPFPSGHIRYLTAGDDTQSIQVIGPDGLPETVGVYGFVVNDERTVYDDHDCAEVDASF